MKKQHFKKALALLLLPVFLLTGCWQDNTDSEGLQTDTLSAGSSAGTDSETFVLPSTLSLPYFSDETLDPVTCSDGTQQTVSALLYEGLYELDQALKPQPKLCSSSSYDPASLTWTFSLRSGVVFSDGSALTAADVAASLQRAQSSDRYRARMSSIQSVTAGNGSLTILLKTANVNLPALLDIPIVKSGTETNLVPAGTGPYVLISDESGTYLSQNAHWWNGQTQPVSRIELVACADNDAARYQFTSQNVQLITADLTGTNPISAAGNFEFQDADTTILQYVGINLHQSLFADAALRRALGLGIDRKSVVSAYLSSHGKATQFPISPVSKAYPASLETEYSYSAYEDAMTAAGFNSGTSRKVTMIVNSENSFKVAIAKYLASSLSAFDLDVEVKPLAWEDYVAALSSGNYDLYYGEVKLTADWDLRPLLGTGGALNYGRYSDATMDLLLTEAAAASDQAAAARSVCAYLQKQAPILPVCFKCTSVLSQAGVVENLTPTASNPFFDIGTCIIHLDDT